MSNPITSPSGKYQLVIKEEIDDGTKHNKFDISKISDGKPGTSAVFSSKALFRTMDTLYFVWGDNDRIWVYSGDVGTFFGNEYRIKGGKNMITLKIIRFLFRHY